ncbi:MAG: 30S ribosomal protein S17 [Candidatus Komeilibacteria bacterium]|nr:30S ribosomal protein S17 [Candidatus Komeilibacteria bacterium]
MSEAVKKILRKFEGEVISDKMDKTVVVKVVRKITHKKYGKKYLSSRNYKCHDETNQYKAGDKVVFAACRPMSKDKRWIVTGKVS